MISIVSDLTELNCIQSFWSCYDVLNYIRESMILWSTNPVSVGDLPVKGKSVGMLAADLNADMARLSAEKNANTAQGITASYFYEMTSFLVTQRSGLEAS